VANLKNLCHFSSDGNLREEPLKVILAKTEYSIVVGRLAMSRRMSASVRRGDGKNDSAGGNFVKGR
jgi:hypothetical protein